MEYLTELLNKRFFKALRAVRERRVKKYVFTPSNRVVWIVIGNLRDYLIISDLYCACEDFYLNVVIRKSAKLCYHLLSKIFAEYFQNYETIQVEDERFDQLMRDWKQF